jgi:DNA mismatch repair protein MutS
MHDGKHLIIKEGRHPVIEQLLPPGETYVANDISLNTEQQQIIIITGPNMSGKSALLRQTALIVLMAQMGSFVPASAASIGIVDKLFTRVGASDNISQGESTFMVEMQEAASILNNLSDRSLVLLDEIGRGTSTYDGISIAWSMVEFIHQNGNSRAKTLFATHYHELNEMEEYFPRVKNFNVSIKQVNEKIVFVRKLVPGGSEHSFGIHVAEMAGMPKAVIARAKEVLKELEANAPGKNRDQKSIVSHMLTSESIAAAKALETAEAKVQADAIAAREAFEEAEKQKRIEQELQAEENTKVQEAKKIQELSEIEALQEESGPAMQLSIFQLDDPVLTQIRDEIRDLDINNLTPLEALNKLNEIKKITGLK